MRTVNFKRQEVTQTFIILKQRYSSLICLHTLCIIWTNVFWCVGLTGAQGRRCDFDLAGGLVGLKGWGPAAGTEVQSKKVRALRPRRAGAGAIASMVGLLFLIHRYQLEEKKEDRPYENGFDLLVPELGLNITHRHCHVNVCKHQNRKG